MLKNKFLVLISLVILLLISNNCTFIGTGFYFIADSKRNNEHYTINQELFSITPGTEINLITTSGDTLAGNYQSNTNEYSSDYINEYNSTYNKIKEQLVVPKIKDTLFITNSIGNKFQYIFLGFDFKSVYVKSTLNDNKLFIKLNSDLKINLTEDQYLEQDWINNAIEFKSIPIMSKMNLENNKDTLSVFYHQIQKIQTKSPNNAAYIILAGVALDLLYLRSIDFPNNPGGGSIWK